MANNHVQDMLKAMWWLKGKPAIDYNIPETAKQLRALSNSVNDPTKDGRDILDTFQAKAGLRKISFSDMTKDQQLAIMSAVGREHGPCYNAFISNAAFRILSLVEHNNFNDVEKLCEGFEVQDLKRISSFLRVFGGQKVAVFRDKFDEIIERKEQEAQQGPKPR